MTGDIDPISHQLGLLSAGLDAVLRLNTAQSNILTDLGKKMDTAQESRELLHAEMRTLKHDQRNTELKLDGLHVRVEQVDKASADKLDGLGARVLEMERWQQRMLAYVSAFGVVGAVIGWIIVHLIFPFFDKAK